MKKLIDKITNKDQLIKLYGCRECNSSGFDTHNLTFCPNCKSKGYTINQDSHVLDIVDELLEARFLMNSEANTKTEDLRIYHIKNDLGHALIKLIELAYEEDPEREWDFTIDPRKLDRGIDYSIKEIARFILHGNYTCSLSNLEMFCNHHKIDIWQAVAEVLEEEK